MELRIPALSLVLLVGPSGAGKSTFAARHFSPTEIVSSDRLRAMICDDETVQAVSADAFELVHQIVKKRLQNGRLTVVDATNARPEHRAPLLRLARDHHVQPVVIALDLAPEVCAARNEARADRQFGDEVVHAHSRAIRASLDRLGEEGVRVVHVLRTAEDVDAALVVRKPLLVDQRDDPGPFDIIGDVHGCFEELLTLLITLGWTVQNDNGTWRATGLPGRKLVFVGDLIDRGPRPSDCLQLAMDLVASGVARVVAGNHEGKLLKALTGGHVKISPARAATLADIDTRGDAFRARVVQFLEDLPAHLVLDGGKLVVVHAGLPQEMHGRDTPKVRMFGIYGEVKDDLDDDGEVMVADGWAKAYEGSALVAYGHTPRRDPVWHHETVDLDTGCCFGGRLTALRYPDRTIVSVPAQKPWCTPKRPLS
jgi:protein phosphatase